MHVGYISSRYHYVRYLWQFLMGMSLAEAANMKDLELYCSIDATTYGAGDDDAHEARA